MKLQPELVIFDWDGTLFDSVGWIVGTLQEAAAEADLEVPMDALARSVVGLGLGEAMATLFPGVSEAQIERLVASYRRLYHREPSKSLTFFPGVEETLMALKSRGLALAVATGKARRGLDAALEATNSRHFFVSSRCADETASKPDPRMILELLSELSVAPERALMVGDSRHDLKMAARAGVPAIAVTTGAHPRAELMPLDPLYCLDDLGELSALIQTPVSIFQYD